MRAEYDFSKGRRGAVVEPARGKTRITIRLDAKVVDWFRQKVHAEGGGSYQAMVNDALEDWIRRHDLERTLRRVIREELRRVA